MAYDTKAMMAAVKRERIVPGKRVVGSAAPMLRELLEHGTLLELIEAVIVDPELVDPWKSLVLWAVPAGLLSSAYLERVLVHLEIQSQALVQLTAVKEKSK